MNPIVKESLDISKRAIDEIGENFSDSSKMRFMIELGELIEKTHAEETKRLKKLVEMVEGKTELSEEELKNIGKETKLTIEEIKEKIMKTECSAEVIFK